MTADTCPAPAKHEVGDVVWARGHHVGDRWAEAVVRAVVRGIGWEYKVSFRLKSGGWANRSRWADIGRR